MRILLFITSLEGELFETAFLGPTGGPRVDSSEVRSQLKDLVADSFTETGLSAVEPVIEKRDVYPFGGTWIPQPIDVEYVVRFCIDSGAEAIIGGFVWEGLRRLKSRFDATEPLAGQAELRATSVQEGDRTARYQIAQMFGVPEADLESVSTGFHGSNGVFVYQAKDGSTFTVNVDAADGVVFHIVRQWPSGPSAEGDEH